MEVRLMTTVKAPPARPLAQFGAALLKTPPARSRVLLAVAVPAAIVEFLGNNMGLWWITIAAGIAAGLVRHRGALTGLIAGTLAGWGAGIIIQAGGQTLAIAGVVSALALNARGLGPAILIITFVYALLLALSGAWIGAAARRVSAARRPAGDPRVVLARPAPTMEETENV
jgi:hypothetical protein